MTNMMKNKSTQIKKILLLSVILSTLNGCMSIAWIGYDKPTDSDYKKIDSVPIRVGIQNLKKGNQEIAITEATKETFKILQSDEFRERVEKREWLISCKIIDGKKDILDGKKVYNILSKGYVDYSINPRHPWRAIAQTQKSENDHTKNRIAIKPKRIKTWYSEDIEIRSLLINTIAHEITHTVSYRFADSGHGSEECPDEDLVSYGVGNMVAEIWRGK